MRKGKNPNIRTAVRILVSQPYTDCERVSADCAFILFWVTHSVSQEVSVDDVEIPITCLRGSLLEKWSLESSRSSSSVLRVSPWERPNFSQPQTFAQPWYGSHNFEAPSVLQMVLDLGDRLLFQAKANEIRNSSNTNAELRRGRHVEGIAGVIHLSQARAKRNRQSSVLFTGALVALGEW